MPVSVDDTTESRSFNEHCSIAIGQLRHALIELLSAIEIDPQGTRSMGRALDINKNLAWRISRITTDDDPAEVVRHMPGRGGMEIFLTAAARHDAPESLISAVRDATDEFDRMVETHHARTRPAQHV